VIRAVASCAVIVALAATATAAVVADTARETRWADEVVPQLVVGDAVWLATARHPRVLALYTKPQAATRNAVIVVHGLGVHPDWNLIGVLRSELADRGFATLSVQMPVLAADARRDDYVDLFPDAGERLAAAVAWLHGHGYARIAIVSHSMGAAMVNAWLAEQDENVIDAWVQVGMFVPMARQPRHPVLDVVAERDFPEVLSLARWRAARLPRDGCSATVTVTGTDHYFGDAASRLADMIAPFIARAIADRC
jgi:alpha-beta hydrolase superfamily lysophospholipase